MAPLILAKFLIWPLTPSGTWILLKVTRSSSSLASSWHVLQIFLPPPCFLGPLGLRVEMSLFQKIKQSTRLTGVLLRWPLHAGMCASLGKEEFAKWANVAPNVELRTRAETSMIDPLLSSPLRWTGFEYIYKETTPIHCNIYTYMHVYHGQMSETLLNYNVWASRGPVKCKPSWELMLAGGPHFITWNHAMRAWHRLNSSFLGASAEEATRQTVCLLQSLFKTKQLPMPQSGAHNIFAAKCPLTKAVLWASQLWKLLAGRCDFLPQDLCKSASAPWRHSEF